MQTHNINQLTVYRETIEFVKLVHDIQPERGFGDIITQIRRAAISTPSNIREGKGIGSNAGFVRHLKIARGSINEAETPLEIMAAIGLIEAQHTAIELASRIGKRLTCLINYLQGR